MDGVVDGVQVQSLGALGQVGLAVGGADLAVDPPCQILLGGIGHIGLQLAAQQLRELAGVLGLFIGGLLPISADLRITLPIGNAGHAQIHTDLGALALEVGAQVSLDVVGRIGGYAEHMLGGVGSALFHLDELLTGNAAQGALEALGDCVALKDVTANGT